MPTPFLLCVEGFLVFAASILFIFLLRDRLIRNHLDNVRGPPPPSYEKGNVEQLVNRDGWAFQKELADKYGPIARLYGPLGKKMLFVFDPLALHHIVVKDQHIFEGPISSIQGNLIIFGPGLLSTLGDRHRRQRKLLNPIFSTTHLRGMLPIFYQVAHQLRDAVATELQEGAPEVDMLSWMGRTSLELIGQAGLGYSFHSLADNRSNAFRDALKALTPTRWSIPWFKDLAPYFTLVGSPRTWRRILQLLPHKGLKQLGLITQTLQQTSEKIFYEKKSALEKGDATLAQHVGEGKDIMSILLRANMTASKSDQLPDDELLGQISQLIFAATDTTSCALSQILYLLAQHPDAQAKLRREIVEASHGADLPYDALMGLPYLDAVCRETLRLHPPVSMTAREALKTTVLPLSKPICGVDGHMMDEIVVPQGTKIIVGVLASNTNEDIWGSDAMLWKPERWLAPLPEALEENRVPGVYSHLMTFLGGGRACIGFQFSQLEMKVVLSLLLSSFVFELSDKPIQWNLATISYPTVGKDSTKPQLPLKVSFAKN